MRYLSLFVSFLLVGCISTKSTIQNIDNNAVRPKISNNTFVLTEYATDTKYGYDADYPINIGLILERQEETYITYFFNALAAKNGEKITAFTKVETCCPFPTKNNSMGAGTLTIYEVQFENLPSKKLYFNIYEKGKIMCPKGFSIQPKSN
ncbi:2-dehydro-3-deoxyphosphooctonate aldolase [Flavobacterium sp.]|uniref:2-dehydro-3-deoxyphosphooctonate aldolase n=1 Tax=Flavobacterium sp. TaxID=239 RepID=UPI0035283425